MAELQGIDVSHHQGSVDWTAVHNSGIEWAIVKATEGKSFVDSQLKRNKAEMARVGLVNGFYHFLRDDSDPDVQARHYLSQIGDPSGRLVALDVETGSNNSIPNQTHVQGWVAEFRRLAGAHPIIIYTGRWYWQDTIGNPNGASFGPLWHSAYSTKPGPLYGGWPKFTMWQYTSSGRVPGVSGNCDRNVFYGERHKLHALALDSSEAPDLDATQNHILHDTHAKAEEIRQDVNRLVRLLTLDEQQGTPAARIRETVILARAIAARDMSVDLDTEDVETLTQGVVTALTAEGVPQEISRAVLKGLGDALNAEVTLPPQNLG